MALLRRELLEEVGLEIDTLGPEIWIKAALYPMGDWDGQVDHVHLVRTSRFQPVPMLSPDELRGEHLHDIRWWSPAELQDSSVTFAPRAMPQLLESLRREGVPSRQAELTGF